MRTGPDRRRIEAAAGGIFLLLGLAATAIGEPPRPARVDFDRTIRPLLARNCFACHGPDAGPRKAGLRLDLPEEAQARLASGRRALVPGDLAASEVFRRIALPASDPRHMPPARSNRSLTPGQTRALSRWIADGARYEKHWAFVPPRRPAVPASDLPNPIDAFLRARLKKEGLAPAPEADRPTLIRRVSLDLTGLPPTSEEADAFVRDRSPDAYERLVDRLLASPHHGERMALGWLDLARYADTHGYHIDSGRDMYRWRDWVIDAFNRNVPYDQFVTEQIAGDLLPGATREQRIATGFNRNHPINFEGGAIPEEYQTAYVADRVDTTATALLGLTLRCGQCHDHKFDPFSTRDYYRFFAYFNNIAEEGLDGQKGNARPFLEAPSPEQERRRAALKERLAALETKQAERIVQSAGASAAWTLPAPAVRFATAGLIARYVLTATPGVAGSAPAPKFVGEVAAEPGRATGALRFSGAGQVDLGEVGDFERSDAFSYGAWVWPEEGGGVPLSRMDSADGLRGWDLYLENGRPLVHLIHRWPGDAIKIVARQGLPLRQWSHVFVTYDGSGKASGLRLFVDGRPAGVDAEVDALTQTLRTKTSAKIGGRTGSAAFRGKVDDVALFRRALSEAEVAALADADPARPLLQIPAPRRTEAQKAQLARLYTERFDTPYRELAAEREAVLKERDALEASIPTTMVMQEREGAPRVTHLLVRGQYDRPGEAVAPGVPEILARLPAGAPANRLGLARWLVAPENPLVARVEANRLWQHFFGAGLVRTAENFGTQGEAPTHPELLDWLACELVRPGAPGARPWDRRRLLRLIVTSATYRQSSVTTPALRRRDPENRLLARAPRLRLPAELVRDQALAVAGLLVAKVGGPSVRPYHPPGLWEELAFDPSMNSFSAQKYVQDHGEALYRRSLYTFWKRTVPPPSLQTFDAPEREFCILRRSATNTPLQALVLMNDPTYVEAARVLAERLLREAPPSPTARIERAYRLVLARPPRAEETRALIRLYNLEASRFRQEPERAARLLGVGESKPDPRFDPAEVAAWTTVTSAVLNLDEAITRG